MDILNLDYDSLVLTEYEVEKFKSFYLEHSKCTDNLSLVRAYNIKLIFNIRGTSIIPSCLCTVCGGESLLAEVERYKEI